MGNIGCKGHCKFFKKVPSNYPKPKKYCTSCEYFVVTDIIRCECCRNVYRLKRKYKAIGSMKMIGRPKEKPLKTRVHPLFDW